MSTTQPEALRLADDLEASSLFPGNMRSCNNAAAAELRRLHAQVVALTAATEVQAGPGKDEATCQMCGEKPYPGCNSEFQDEAACRFYHPADAKPAPVQALSTAPLMGAAADAGWVTLPGTLPEPGKPVLLDIGKKYPTRAMWAAKFTLPVGLEDDSGFGEHDECTDEWYCPEGWYEWNEHEEVHWSVTSTPVAWCALPAPLQR